MLAGIEGESTSIRKIVEQPEEREDGPTSVNLEDKQISIGELSTAVPQEDEKLQEQVQEQQEELKASKRKQKRRGVTSYLSSISKQIDKQGNQINKLTMMIRSVQQGKQIQTKSTKAIGISQSYLQSTKQILSQVYQLQKQVSRIQIDIQKLRTISGVGTKTTSRANVKSKSKKSKLREYKSTSQKKKKKK